MFTKNHEDLQKLTINAMISKLVRFCRDQPDCSGCKLFNKDIPCGGITAMARGETTLSDEEICNFYAIVFSEEAPKKDVIEHPEHYCYSKYEPKDVIRAWGLNFNLGSAVKYIARAGRKDDILQDLKKARQFLTFEIEALEAERDA